MNPKATPTEVKAAISNAFMAVHHAWNRTYALSQTKFEDDRLWQVEELIKIAYNAMSLAETMGSEFIK